MRRILYLLISLFEVWLLISIVNTCDILLFVCEINLIVVKPVDLKTYIKDWERLGT